MKSAIKGRWKFRFGTAAIITFSYGVRFRGEVPFNSISDVDGQVLGLIGQVKTRSDGNFVGNRASIADNSTRDGSN